MENRYELRVILSSEADESFQGDFCAVCNAVFGEGSMTLALFRKKYVDNIYGDSVLCVAYSQDGEPAAARALWRNDVAGRQAYQPCDTCVLKKHRRQGLFEKMTFAALEKVSKIEGSHGPVVYNYPNDNSRGLYLKLGWTVAAEYKPRLWAGGKVYSAEHPEILSEQYYNWWLDNGNPSKNRIRKIAGSHYLVRDYGRLFQIVIARIPESVACKLEKASKRPLLFWSEKKCFYNSRRESRIVVRKVDKADADIKIPVWKMDVL